MFSESVIDADTVQAYLETAYRVCSEVPFTLRIGTLSPDLLAAHQRHGVDCSAFLTASNPFSRTLNEAKNLLRQQALAKELVSRGLAHIDGVGQHPLNNWPGEQSFLIFGLKLEEATAFAERFEQNALVWSGSDGTPQLILLR